MGMLRQLFDEINALLMNSDADGLRRYYAPSIEFKSPYGNLVGIDPFVERFRQALANGRFESMEVIASVEQGDTFVAEGTVVYRAGGVRVTWPMMTWLRFEDGLVVSEHEYYDVKAIDAQMAAQQADTATP